MLELKNFGKIYENGTIGAKDINLTINSGDIFAFIGHNGAGKTTTIKSIVGINKISSGDIIVDGISVNENSLEAKKIIAYIPDNPDIYESLTGIQYINFIADVYKVSLEERKNLTLKYADMLELTDDLNAPISTYSHGMKQKLVIISALIHSPKVLILDEPFVGLDPKASFILKEIMREFCNNGGCIFFSTHVLEVAEKICDKIGIIKGGKLMAYGKTNEVIGDKSLENIFMEMIENE